MNYYFWCCGYEYAGVVKADSLKEAKEKVILSKGIKATVYSLDDEDFDENDVCTLIM